MNGTRALRPKPITLIGYTSAYTTQNRDNRFQWSSASGNGPTRTTCTFTRLRFANPPSSKPTRRPTQSPIVRSVDVNWDLAYNLNDFTHTADNRIPFKARFTYCRINEAQTDCLNQNTFGPGVRVPWTIVRGRFNATLSDPVTGQMGIVTSWTEGPTPDTSTFSTVSGTVEVNGRVVGQTAGADWGEVRFIAKDTGTASKKTYILRLGRGSAGSASSGGDAVTVSRGFRRSYYPLTVITKEAKKKEVDDLAIQEEFRWVFVAVFAVIVIVCCCVGWSYYCSTKKMEAELVEQENELQEAYRQEEDGDAGIIVSGWAKKAMEAAKKNPNAFRESIAD